MTTSSALHDSAQFSKKNKKEKRKKNSLSPPTSLSVRVPPPLYSPFICPPFLPKAQFMCPSFTFPTPPSPVMSYPACPQGASNRCHSGS